jgi:Ca2+-transporting ATPase
MEFYNLGAKESLKKLKTSEEGLPKKEAAARLGKYGPNELKKEKGDSALVIFLRQFKNFLILILLIATVIAYMVGEVIDAIVIAVIVVLNAIMGLVQEYKAEKSLEALKKLTSPYAVVIRGGKQTKIPAGELVPGDIMVIEMGDKIPADARIIESLNLKADESALTGESIPVSKEPGKLSGKMPLGDQRNMLYSGTIITYGKGRAVVTATGMDTELGRIAGMVQETEREETPLQKRLAVLGKQLGLLVIAISAIVFIVGIMKMGWTPQNVTVMFLAAVALAVAAIPEGLPAVVTMALALGTQRMAKKNAIIRKLPAVETLGSCDVICSDKTGTLTKNEMTVRWMYADGRGIEVTGSGYEKKGEFLSKGGRVKPGDDKALDMLLRAGVLCNNASIDEETVGDPTEISLLVAGAKAGMDKEGLEDACSRLHELQFDSQRKRMSTVNKNGGKRVMYTKGAVEIVLDLCDRIYKGGKIEKLTGPEKKAILTKNEEMAGNALRLLGFAYKELGEDEKYGDAEQGLVFLGMAGMIDPPREEVIESIRICKKAGIDVKMITGDHALTAKAIAKELDMLRGEVVTGLDLDKMSDDELVKRVESISVFARVNPEHKLRIVEALQKNGHIVAMTGDGVNDAPALKKSDIGVAMGITGTEVTKEASSMVLTDDNFATIVSAIEEGRVIYDNIKKFIRFLLSSNLGEVLTLFFAILIFPREALILVPVQILWVNLVTDGAPALALGLEPGERGIMGRPPRPAKDRIFSGVMLKTILIVGFTIAIGTIWVFNYYLSMGEMGARTMAFTTLVMFQLVNVFNCKSEKESLFKVGIFNNKYLILAVIASVALQFLVIYAPFLSVAFETVQIGFIQWAVIIEIAFSAFLVVELYKIIERKRSMPQQG